MFIKNILLISLIVNSLFVWTDNPGGKPANDTNYPSPVKSEKLMFYVQRSHNKNTIAYDLNMISNGKLNTDEPIHPYWIRFEEGGIKQELSFIQRKFAYGLDCELVDKAKGKYSVYFVCYKKRNMYLMRVGKDNNYHVCMQINGIPSIINRIYFKYEGGPFWFPVVRYVDLSGTEIASGKEITERFIP